MSTVANSTHSSITGHFEELKREIASFHTIYDQWLASRQQVVTVDKLAFQKTLEEEQELAKEQAEFEEVSKANAELAAQATLLQQRHSALQRQNDQIDAEIASESKSKEFFHLPAFLAVLEQQEAVLKAQESQLMQLCEQFERRLGLEIVSSNGKCGVILSQSSVTETDGSTSTTLIYTLIDPNDWDRKFIVQFSTNTGDFFISKCEPMLPQLASLIEEMRSDRNIFNFVKKVRQAFQLCNFK